MGGGFIPLTDDLDDLAGSSVEIHHFGELKERAHPDLVLHGRYDNAVLPELLRPLKEFRMVIYSALLIGLMLTRPQGVLGDRELDLRRFFARWRRPAEPT